MIEIEYRNIADQSLQLDIHGADPGQIKPAIFYVHGGGWCTGTRKDEQWLFDQLARGGFLVVSISYRLAPKYRWPACLEDVSCAAQWCQNHLRKYGADPDRMIAMGYSAGGQLALLNMLTSPTVRFRAGVGLAAPVDKVLDMLRRGGQLSESMKNLFGVDKVDSEIVNHLWDISPINHLRPGHPPTLMIGCTEDQSVPYVQAVHFQKRARDIGLSCDLITIPRAGHRITTWSDFHASWINELINWMRHQSV